MDKFLVKGPCKIKGQIFVSGSKNAALPILAATLLFDKTVIIENLPRVKDIDTMINLLKSLGSNNLFSLIPYCKFVIGNSSSGIIEVPYFKIPTINIGDRQKGRIFHKSIINCGYSSKEINNSLKKALSSNFSKKIKKMKYKFGNANASNIIVKTKKKIKFNENFLRKKLIFN